MLYLRTGANGTCKTLFTLADVRKLQLETGRPVAINGRFKIKPEKLQEFGWKVIEFKDWQAEPDGTIFLIDECHNDMPVRPTGSVVPDAIRMLAEHRSRGFDFFFLTQHPMNIDSFVRKLIGAPGWHQHLKRVFGGTNVTRVLQWDAVNTSCEKDGSGKSAQITTRTHPKEVYGWYDSATLHTAKTRIPGKVKLLAVLAIVIPALVWVAYQRVKPKPAEPPPATAPAAPSRVAPVDHGTAGAPGEKRILTAAEYAQSYRPRIEGFEHTATRYDGVTQPTQAPYPAACVAMGTKCKCYTQQATILPTPEEICRQIVKGGFFMDWGQQQGPQIARSQPAAAPVGLPAAFVPDASDKGPAAAYKLAMGVH